MTLADDDVPIAAYADTSDDGVVGSAEDRTDERASGEGTGLEDGQADDGATVDDAALDDTGAPPHDPVAAAMDGLGARVDDLAVAVRALADELSLTNRRNLAQEAILERLQDAERQVRAAAAHPFALALHRVLVTLGAIDVADDVRAGLRFELDEALASQGYEAFGASGDRFDPTRHDALSGRVEKGQGVVEHVFSVGLVHFDKVVTRARVSVTPPQADD